MKKFLLIISLITVFTLTSCNKKKEKELIYKNNKVIVSLKTYNKLKTDMHIDKVWKILGGKCENITPEIDNTEDNINDDELKTLEYGCNGNGEYGSNVILTFVDSKLYVKTEVGLK